MKGIGTYFLKGLLMKKCERFRQHFSDYIDGLLDSTIRLELENHLENCPRCLKVIQRMKNVSQKLKHLPGLKTSPDFDMVLRTRIRVESGLERKSWSENKFKWSIQIPVYAASIAIIWGAFVFINDQNIKQNQGMPLSFQYHTAGDTILSNTKQDKNVYYELPIYPVDYFLQRPAALPSAKKVNSIESDSLRQKQLSKLPHSKKQIQNNRKPVSFTF